MGADRGCGITCALLLLRTPPPNGRWTSRCLSRCAIKGCNIISYLLEKTRVVQQTPSERNYHCFYMLLAGASDSLRADLWLQAPEQYQYLNQSGCTVIPGRSEQQEFGILQESMAHLRLEDQVPSISFM